MLKDAIGGNAKTTMLAAVSPRVRKFDSYRRFLARKANEIRKFKSHSSTILRLRFSCERFQTNEARSASALAREKTFLFLTIEARSEDDNKSGAEKTQSDSSCLYDFVRLIFFFW